MRRAEQLWLWLAFAVLAISCNGANIIYSIDPSVGAHLTQVVRSAMDEWETGTDGCVSFLARTNETDYTEFVNKPNIEECYSEYNSMQLAGKQTITLGYKCKKKGTVLYLIGQALGLVDEQNRCDRDQYVSIAWDNIAPGKEHFFEADLVSLDYQGTPYDLSSAMHLGSTAYTKNGRPTIYVSVNERQLDIEEADTISSKDAIQLSRLYNCPGEGMFGRLMITVHNTTCSPADENTARNSKFLEITTVDSNGNLHTEVSKMLTEDVESCPQQIEMPNDYEHQFFRVAIIDENGTYSDSTCTAKTIPIVVGNHMSIELYYKENGDEHRILYDYSFDEDDCRENPCQNDGTCIDKIDGHICNCSCGYTGEYCSELMDTDQCSSSPCQNNGHCSDLICDYSCSCPCGYAGKSCEDYNDTDQCSSSPCQNGGQCTDLTCDYSCDCACGYGGKNCEQYVDTNQCSSSPCQNNGICSDLTCDYSCDCPCGYGGKNCEHFIDGDQCFSSPCQNGGLCTDLICDYLCDCPCGYAGDNCEHYIDTNQCLSSPCQNGGRCSDLTCDYSCECPCGYGGKNCELYTDTDQCTSNPCQNNGICTDLTCDYSCECACGYAGINCENYIDSDQCSSSPCQHGGHCTDLTCDYSCDCQCRYDGKNCQHQRIFDPINQCHPSRCLNGGTCVDQYCDYDCLCPCGYTGKNCESRRDEVNQCMSSPCQNRANCRDLYCDYDCQCPCGYAGKNCQTYIDGNQCSPSPCENGGTCRDLTCDYECRCPSLYLGQDCATRRQGDLRIYAIGGSGLRDTDGWFAGDSDPYLRVIAYDSTGYSRGLNTRTDDGDESPTWNQSLYFGTRSWVRIAVRIYDEDTGSDDSLSNWETFYLESFPISGELEQHNGYSGYITFLIYFQ